MTGVGFFFEFQMDKIFFETEPKPCRNASNSSRSSFKVCLIFFVTTRPSMLRTSSGRSLDLISDLNIFGLLFETMCVRDLRVFADSMDGQVCHYRGETVIDTFGGSGSTLIDCEQTGRVGRAMELDEKYCDVIRRRWAEFVHGEGCDWQALTPVVEHNFPP